MILLVSALAAPTVAQTGPSAELTVSPDPAIPDEPVVLDGRNSTAPNASIETCEFDVDGDGTYDVRTPDCLVNETYTEVGVYDLQLRVTTETGEQATDTVTLSVARNEPPVADIAIAPNRPLPGEAVTFSGANSSDPDGEIVSYAWELASGRASGQTTTVTFDDPGVYEARLTVTDDDGATTETSALVDVEPNEAPSVHLSLVTEDPSAGEMIRFDASGSDDPDGSIATYRWDLDGDGAYEETTNRSEASIIKETPGNFLLGLEVVDDRGATARETLEYTVLPAQPSPTATTADPGQPVQDDREAGPLLPSLLLGGILVLLLVGGVAMGLRRRSLIGEAITRIRSLLTRGDVRRRLGQKLSGTMVKKATKQAIKRFSDLVETGGDVVGGALERAGRAIKRGSSRLADWLRRLAS